MNEEQAVGFLRAAAATFQPKKRTDTLEKHIAASVGTTMRDLFAAMNVRSAQEAANKYPDTFYVQYGQLQVVQGDDAAAIRENTASGTKRGGGPSLNIPRGRAGRGGRGGYQNTAPSSFGRGGYNSSFSSRGGGTSGGGFGGGRGGYSNQQTNDSHRDNYSNQASDRRPDYGSQDRRPNDYGAQSNQYSQHDDRSTSYNNGGGGGGYGRSQYDDDRSRTGGGGRGGGYDERDQRSNYNQGGRDEQRGYDDQYRPRQSDNRGFASNNDNFEEVSRGGYDQGRNNRGPSPQQHYSDDEYDDDDDYYNPNGQNGRQVRYSPDQGRHMGRESPVVGGYRNRSPERYGNQQGGAGGAGRYDEDERRGGRGGAYNDDDDYDRREENRPKTGFPSAFGSTSRGTAGNLFAPKAPVESNEYYESTSNLSGSAAGFGAGGGRRRGDPGTPEDPKDAKQPVSPTSGVSRPPGFNYDKYPVPPGFEKYSGPPPGLGNLRGLTPTQAAVQSGRAGEESIEVISLLVFDTLMAHGGKPILASEIVGLVLHHCRRDIGQTVINQGGPFKVLEGVCYRSPDRMEFNTEEDGDYIQLMEPFLSEARAKQQTSLPFDNLEPGDSASQISYTESYRTADPTFRNGATESEIRRADEVWKFIQQTASYDSKLGQYTVEVRAISEQLRIDGKAFVPLAMKHFSDYFEVRFDNDKGTLMFCTGKVSPAADLLSSAAAAAPPAAAVAPLPTRESTVAASSTRDSAPPPPRRVTEERESERDRRETSHVGSGSSRATRRYKFYHVRNDPEDGYPSVRSYKKSEKVILSAFNDYLDFYVQTESDKRKYQNQIVPLFDDHVNALGKEKITWRSGDVACFVDPSSECAYRVKIVRVKEGGDVQVQSVDLGWKRDVEERDLVPLLQKYETAALCFPCALEDFEPDNEDELLAYKRAMRKMSEAEAVIEPLKKLEDDVLVVRLLFTNDYGREQILPDYLYQKNIASKRT